MLSLLLLLLLSHKRCTRQIFTAISGSLLFHRHHLHGVFRCAGFWTTSGCIIYCQTLQHEQKQSGQPVLQRGGGGLHLHRLKTLPEFEAHRLRSSGNCLVCIQIYVPFMCFMCSYLIYLLLWCLYCALKMWYESTSQTPNQNFRRFWNLGQNFIK